MKQENKNMKKKSRSKYHKPASRRVVSVVIPVFNGAEYLVDAVRSIQKSSLRRFEVLLIDNGSTDQSKELCRMLTKRYKNVRYYDFPRNKGLGRVLNFALKKARGRYICRLNQDDRMLPHRIATQIRYLNNHRDVVAVGSWIRLFDAKGRSMILKFIKDDTEIKRLWYIVSPFSDPSVMYRKDIAITAGGYFQSMWPADDTHLWYRLGMRGKLANIQKPLVEVRWHPDAASVKYFRKLAQSTFKMHLWTDQFLTRAPWYVHVYWIIQYIAGMTISPEANWGIYRGIKRVIAFYEERLRRLRKTMRIAATVAAVPSQPKRLSLSGV